MAKTVEIDEETYNRLKGVATLAEQIHANPEGRKLLEQAHKTINPNAKTPTLDSEARVAAPISDVQKQIADLTKLVADKFSNDENEKKLSQLDRQQQEGIQRLRQAGYTDQGIEAVQKVMSEKGILDVEIAAAYHEKINPPMPVTPTGSNSVNLLEAFNAPETDTALKKLLESRGESESALNTLVQESLSEIRNPATRR